MAGETGDFGDLAEISETSTSPISYCSGRITAWTTSVSRTFECVIFGRTVDQ